MLASNRILCDDKIYQKMIQDKGAVKILYIGRFEEREIFIL